MPYRALLFLPLAACYIFGSKSDFEHITRSSLDKTAAFDLGCAPDQLAYTPLGDKSDGYDKVGVTGCGKKATYIFVTGRETWVKDSETTGAPAQK